MTEFAERWSCPFCDDPLIDHPKPECRRLERGRGRTPFCLACGRELRDGDEAWVDDWKVIDTKGDRIAFHTESRYTCGDCHMLHHGTTGE